MGSTLLQNRLDLVFLAEVLFAHVVDFQAISGGHCLGIGLDGVGQRLGEPGEIENPNPPRAQVSRLEHVLDHHVRIRKISALSEVLQVLTWEHATESEVHLRLPRRRIDGLYVELFSHVRAVVPLRVV